MNVGAKFHYERPNRYVVELVGGLMQGDPGFAGNRSGSDKKREQLEFVLPRIDGVIDADEITGGHGNVDDRHSADYPIWPGSSRKTGRVTITNGTMKIDLYSDSLPLRWNGEYELYEVYSPHYPRRPETK
jgi:hypothetical protein